MFFDGLSDFEKGAIFCAMDSANSKSDMRPFVRLMFKHYKSGHLDWDSFLREVRPIVPYAPYASDDEIIQAAQEAIHEELRRRGLE